MEDRIADIYTSAEEFEEGEIEFEEIHPSGVYIFSSEVYHTIFHMYDEELYYQYHLESELEESADLIEDTMEGRIFCFS